MNTELAQRLLEVAENIGRGEMIGLSYRTSDGQIHELQGSDFAGQDAHNMRGLVFEALMRKLLGADKGTEETSADMEVDGCPIEVKHITHIKRDVQGGDQCVGRPHVIYWCDAGRATLSYPARRSVKGYLSPINRPSMHKHPWE